MAPPICFPNWENWTTGQKNRSIYYFHSLTLLFLFFMVTSRPGKWHRGSCRARDSLSNQTMWSWVNSVSAQLAPGTDGHGGHLGGSGLPWAVLEGSTPEPGPGELLSQNASTKRRYSWPQFAQESPSFRTESPGQTGAVGHRRRILEFPS